MNERIKELSHKAWIDSLKVSQDTYSEEFRLCYNEKFAELIVRECVDKLKETKKVELPYLQATNETIQELPLSVYIAELKAHFGVEE